MALRDGVAAPTIATILGGDAEAMSDELALGVKFAHVNPPAKNQ